MADLSKLDWFANWQNALSFLAGVGAGIALGPLTPDQFLLVFIIAFAAARLVTAMMEALWKHFRRTPPRTPPPA